jgi:hypothetical protein
MAVLSCWIEAQNNNPARSHPSTHTHAQSTNARLRNGRKWKDGKSGSACACRKNSSACSTCITAFSPTLCGDETRSNEVNLQLAGRTADLCAETSHDDRRTHLNISTMSIVWSTTSHVKNTASVQHLLFPHDTAQLWLSIALAHMSKIPYTCSSCSLRPKLAIRVPILGYGSPAYRVVV